MAFKPVRILSLPLVPLLFCAGIFTAIATAKDKPQAAQAGEQLIVEQIADGFGDTRSAFSRAVTASDKRNQAADYWQTFQRTDDDDALERSLTYLAEAIALAPDSKSTWQLAARIHYSLRNIPAFKLEAINSFEKLLQLDAQDLSSRVLLIDELISLWRWQQATYHLEAMFAVNAAVAADTVLDRMVICYLKAGLHERGAAFFNQQIVSTDSKEPLLIARAIVERGSGNTNAALASLGEVLFSNSAPRQMRAKARELKTYWQENEWVPVEEISK